MVPNFAKTLLVCLSAASGCKPSHYLCSSHMVNMSIWFLELLFPVSMVFKMPSNMVLTLVWDWLVHRLS